MIFKKCSLLLFQARKQSIMKKFLVTFEKDHHFHFMPKLPILGEVNNKKLICVLGYNLGPGYSTNFNEGPFGEV